MSIFYVGFRKVLIFKVFRKELWKVLIFSKVYRRVLILGHFLDYRVFFMKVFSRVFFRKVSMFEEGFMIFVTFFGRISIFFFKVGYQSGWNYFRISGNIPTPDSFIYCLTVSIIQRRCDGKAVLMVILFVWVYFYMAWFVSCLEFVSYKALFPPPNPYNIGA